MLENKSIFRSDFVCILMDGIESSQNNCFSIADVLYKLKKAKNNINMFC